MVKDDFGDFELPPRKWQQVIDLIKASPVGLELLLPFSEKVKSKKLSVCKYPQEVIAKLREQSSSDDPVGAFFLTDGDVGNIYLDTQSPIGVLVPFFVHEIVHSLDESLWHASKRPMTSWRKNETIFNAECRAYRLQHRFQEELKNHHPELRKFHQTRYPNIACLNREILPHELADLYSNFKNRCDTSWGTRET